ncbi:hypothetical protein [Lysobacter sp. D1-1-M9]|uniref:hypothetical protein n=1 Tax=Novilysobacter longmucuonensis TaxID=3098603 RepID=UPI002FC99EC3
MFEDAQPQLERILTLVAACPEKLQEKCFEILLNAYVQGMTPLPSAVPIPITAVGATVDSSHGNNGTPIPEAIRSKLVSLAGRNKVPLDKAAALFDFNTDPFTFHAHVAPGANKAEKTRNVALALSLKNYLTTGNWSTDWMEFRAACIDQNCFDRANTGTTLGKGGLFKTCTQAEGITLSSRGVTAAEALFASLAGGGSE